MGLSSCEPQDILIDPSGDDSILRHVPIHLTAQGYWVEGYPDEFYTSLYQAKLVAHRVWLEQMGELGVNVTAVQERLVISDAELTGYLGVTDPSDPVLLVMLQAAKEAADAYCNNPFLNSDGVEVAIPEGVKLGVLRWVEQELKKQPIGVTSERAGDLARTYSAGAMAIHEAALSHWRRYRVVPGL